MECGEEEKQRLLESLGPSWEAGEKREKRLASRQHTPGAGPLRALTTEERKKERWRGPRIWGTAGRSSTGRGTGEDETSNGLADSLSSSHDYGKFALPA